MQHTCTQCLLPFTVTEDDLKFYDSVSPVFAGKKYVIPPPTQCPDCRQQRRLAQCNERHFFNAECGLCKTRMLTQYPPTINQPIYCRECWHSDKWDSCDYGRDVDFSRPIFPQIMEVQRTTPLQNLLIEGTNQNSEYIHYAGFSKDCYLIMHADYCEDCMYGYGFKHNKSCMDGFYNLHSELLYDCVDCHKSYGLTGCQDCFNCNGSAFLRDCVGCKDCFLCVGLRNKQYCLENEQLTAGEYKSRLAKINTGSHAAYQRCVLRRRELERQHHFKSMHGHNLQNSTGNYLYNCKDTQQSYDCEDVEGGKFLYQVVTGAKNVYDIYQYGLNLQQSYECSVAGNNCYNVCFCHNVHVSSANLLYCCYAQATKNCFGCCSLHNKQYCILNKQYTKEEYEKLMPKIIEHMRATGEWGEFFPAVFSLFGYNRTTAQMYYPRTRQQAVDRGLQWDDSALPSPTAEKTVPAERLPDDIRDIPGDVLNWAVQCEVTKRPFRITKRELAMYRERGLPLPRRCPDQRHMDRFLRRNPRQMWERTCGKCAKAIQTTYSPERPEQVYCEQCYQEATY